MKLLLFAIALAGLALLRWATWDVAPVPEVAATKMFRFADATCAAPMLTYLPTYLGGDPKELLEQSFCVDPKYGDGSALSVVLRSSEGVTSVGVELPVPAVLRVRWTAAPPPGQEIHLVRGGDTLLSGSTELEASLTEPGVYHIEVSRLVPTWYFGHARVTWIVTKPFTLVPAHA